MYRCSDSIDRIGKEVLLDLLCTEKPVFRLVERDLQWRVQKCKVVAITNDKLILSGLYEDKVFMQSSDSVLVVNGNMADISEQECTWYFEQEVAEFEVEMRNDYLQGGYKCEV